MDDQQKRDQERALTAARIAKQAFVAGWRACEASDHAGEADEDLIRRERDRWAQTMFEEYDA